MSESLPKEMKSYRVFSRRFFLYMIPHMVLIMAGLGLAWVAISTPDIAFSENGLLKTLVAFVLAVGALLFLIRAINFWFGQYQIEGSYISFVTLLGQKTTQNLDELKDVDICRDLFGDLIFPCASTRFHSAKNALSAYGVDLVFRNGKKIRLLPYEVDPELVRHVKQYLAKTEGAQSDLLRNFKPKVPRT